MNNSDLIDLLTTCKTICGTEAKFYSRFKKGSVHAVMPSKFAAIDHALDKAIAALSAQPQVCCGEYATCLRACTPRGKWLQAQESADLSGANLSGVLAMREQEKTK